MQMKRRTKKRLSSILAMCCVLSMLVSTMAFFTDRETQTATAQAGNMDLVFTDISASKTGTNQITSVNTFAQDEAWVSGLVEDGKIINPGDNFDLTYKMSNTGNKSMDVRQRLTVTSTVPMTNVEEFKLRITGEDYNTTVVDGKMSDDGMSIVYDLDDIILNGSGTRAETEEGVDWSEQTYTVELLFDLAAKNAFQNAGVAVALDAQAKQHRNTSEDDWAEWGSVETEFERISSDGLIELASAEDVMSLSRILARNTAKTNFIYSDPDTLSIEDDLNNFDIPEELTAESDKISYLQSASYKLVDDVDLTMSRDSGTNFFLGVGSDQYPFTGSFDGNDKTITLSATGNISPNGNCSPYVGFFGKTEDANITNTNLAITDDLIVNQAVNQMKLGALAGQANNTKINNCSLTISDSDFGVIYPSTTSYKQPPRVGGLVGYSLNSTYRNCDVVMNNSSIVAKGHDYSDSTEMYAMFSVGGIIGFSDAGSDNTENIGRLGNQLYDCHLVSNNTTQTDVIIASVETGQEICAGGLVGCTYNNFVAKDCSVEITKGNIVAAKTGDSDVNSHYGTQAGGIVGRLEHTGELSNCDVTGDYLNIISESPHNTSTAGGITGIFVGPYHRDVVSVNNCSFDGSGTSNISVEITSNDNNVNKAVAAGGIAGRGTHKITGCSVKDTIITNKSEGISNNSGAGSIVGQIFEDGLWVYSPYFSSGITASQVTGCTASGVTFDVSDNVVIYGN